jgi:hypothetical protein
MTKRTFVDKNGNFWEWEETEEVLQALKELHENKTNTEPANVG